MTFVQLQNRLTMHFSERIPIVKRTHGCSRLYYLGLCTYTIWRSDSDKIA